VRCEGEILFKSKLMGRLKKRHIQLRQNGDVYTLNARTKKWTLHDKVRPPTLCVSVRRRCLSVLPFPLRPRAPPRRKAVRTVRAAPRALVLTTQPDVFATRSLRPSLSW
jgi:hypothetical protein